MNKVLCLVPARGGSVGLPGKNIRRLGDKPLIAHVINTALSCSWIDKVLVTTDDPEIQKIALQYGAESPFLRPKELASSTAKTVDALRHAIAYLEDSHEFYDDIILMQPTQPFTSQKALTESYRLFLQHNRQGVLSVSEVKEHPILMRSMTNNYLTPILKGSSTIRRQDMATYYKVNGAIYINSRQDFRSVNLSLNDNPIGYEMSEQVVDIDTIEDLLYAEYLLEQRDNSS